MSNPTVLLIDYEPASIEQMKGPLLAAGYNVEVVFDGIAGLKAFNDMKPDLVLIEAMIPKKHGFEVCQEIKKTPEGKDTPVVIATSIYKGRKYRNQALKNYGCDEYLEKPVAGEDLMEVCRRYLKEVEQQVVETVADRPSVQDDTPRQADQGLNNLDAMDEREISDKLDEILGAFGDAVDDAREPEPAQAPQAAPSPDPVTDQDMVMELLDEVGNAEPVELAGLSEQPAAVDEPPVAELEPKPEPEPEPEPETEPEPEPEREPEADEAVETTRDTEAELSSEVDEVFPEAAYAGRTAEEYLSGVPIDAESEPTGGSGTRFLGLGVPAWIGIAAAVIVAAVGGFLYFGQPDGAASVAQVASEAAVPRTVETPVVSPALEPEKSEAVEPAGTDVAAQEPDPVPAEPVAVIQKPEPVKAKVVVPEQVEATPVPAKKAVARSAPPAKKEPTPVVQPKPTPAEPETVVVQPAPRETIARQKAESTLEPAAEQSREVIAPQEQVVQVAAPVSKPVVQEKARRVLAKPGDLVPLNSVDTPPVQQVNVAPKYHPMARKLGQQGTVQLNLLIDETGAVTDVKVVREIPNSTLNQMAVKAVRQWVYEPAVKDNAPVKVWKQVSLEFRL